MDKTLLIGQLKRHDNTTGRLLDYPCFKEYLSWKQHILSKQQDLDADPNAIPQIVTGNLTQVGDATMFFITE